jgi:hypothetical protein
MARCEMGTQNTSHPTATLNHGIPVLIVTKRLGHAMLSITLDIYGHVIPSMQEQVARIMDEVVTPIEFFEQIAPGCTTQYQNDLEELKSPHM